MKTLNLLMLCFFIRLSSTDLFPKLVNKPQKIGISNESTNYHQNNGLKIRLRRDLGSVIPCGTGPPVEGLASRVVGGHDAEPGQFPFQVHLQAKILDGYIRCSGTIIGEWYILTAAHCMGICGNLQLKANDLQVTIGEYSTLDEDGEIYVNISEIIAHKDFDCTGPDDIALLVTSEPIQYNLLADGYGSVNRVCMPTESSVFKVGERVIVAGWGAISLNNKRGTEILQTTELELKDDLGCQRAWAQANKDIDLEKQICAADPVGWSNVCDGDSGGPLIRLIGVDQYELIGIASLGRRDCVNQMYPTVFTRVTYYLDWIEAMMS